MKATYHCNPRGLIQPGRKPPRRTLVARCFADRRHNRKWTFSHQRSHLATSRWLSCSIHWHRRRIPSLDMKEARVISILLHAYMLLGVDYLPRSFSFPFIGRQRTATLTHSESVFSTISVKLLLCYYLLFVC